MASASSSRLLNGAILVAVVVAIVAWVAPTKDAQAGREYPCADGWISQAVQNATGNTAVDHVCNPALYNNGQWSSQSELQGYVNGVMQSCGSDQTHKNLTQAVIEVTGIPPTGTVCDTSIYQTVYNRSCQSGCGGIDWSHYKNGSGFEQTPAYMAVYQGLQTCADPVLTQGLIQTLHHLPDNDRNGDYFSFWHSEEQTRKQCNGTLYGHYGWYSYSDLLSLINQRVNAPTCTSAKTSQGNYIDTAFVGLTGWHPLNSECNALHYRAGFFDGAVDPDTLQHLVVGSLRCQDPWIGEVYELDYGRIAHGRDGMGECNPILYGNGHWDGGTGIQQFQRLESLVQQTQSNLSSVNWSFPGTNGDLRAKLPAGQGGQTVTFDGGEVRFANLQDGIIRTASGNVIAAGGGNVIAAGGGNVIAPNAGQILQQSGSNIISTGGGSVIAAGGGNLISDKGLGLTAGGGGNVIAAGGGN
jgi:hypothetical protein